MRIGKFAEDNNLSIDTIRHYMDIGLILPEKQGGQYYFDSRCQKDLEDILEFKNMGFSLGEIKTISLFKNFGKLTAYQQDMYYKTLFQDKYSKLGNEIKNLALIKDKLKTKIESFSTTEPNENFKIGIDLRHLNLFKCHKCDKDLILQDGTISNNQVIHGKLSCRCGEEYEIEDGILRIGKPPEQNNTDISERNVSEYIYDTDNSYLDNLLKSLEWSVRKLKGINLNNKIMLELGTGMGFFLRNIYEELADDCIYIAVDYSIERHQFLKSMIERAEQRKNIIFICSDFLDIPLKKKSVDILLDISGTSNYSFEHEGFLLNEVIEFTKMDSDLLGSYILFKNFSNKSLIESKYRKNFMLKSVKDSINKLGFRMIDEKVSDYVDKGGKYENFFVEGETIYSYSYFGKR